MANKKPSIQPMSAQVRAVRTAFQVVSSLVVGLIVTVWGIEGVPQAVFDYLGKEAVALVGTSGVAGLAIGYLMNRTKSVK